MLNFVQQQLAVERFFGMSSSVSHLDNYVEDYMGAVVLKRISPDRFSVHTVKPYNQMTPPLKQNYEEI